MRNSYDVIKIDNYSKLNDCRIFISENSLFLSINLDLKHGETNIRKIFKTNIILMTKYLNLKETKSATMNIFRFFLFPF